MRVSYLGQGFDNISPNSVGNKLIQKLGAEDFNTFFAITAFASAAGVKGLSSYINDAKKRFDNIIIIVGIDQNGTSKEALEEIAELGINGFIFYQLEAPIFHPKIYLFEGSDINVLILGSSNLTSTGLFNNIEGSLMIEFNSGDSEGEDVIRQIKEYHSSLFDLSDPNLFKINPSTISGFIDRGIVAREATRIKYHGKRKGISSSSLTIPARSTSTIPSNFRAPRRLGSTGRIQIIETGTLGDETAFERGNLIWSRNNLPASSVQIPNSSNTSPTGGLRLVQGGFRNEGSIINQTTYFRQDIFASLDWRQVSTDPFVEVATCEFLITIKGEFWGKYNLTLRHKPSGEAGQGNYTTSITWGEASQKIRDANLIGARIEIYSPINVGEPYQIEII